MSWPNTPQGFSDAKAAAGGDERRLLIAGSLIYVEPADAESPVTVTESGAYSSDWPYAITDADDNLLLGIDRAGKTTCKLTAESLAWDSLAVRDFAITDTYAFYSRADVQGIAQIYRQTLANGQVTALTNATTASGNLTVSGTKLFYQRDGIGYYQTIGTWSEHTIIPLRRFVCYGDSLSTSYYTQLAALTGIPGSTYAVGGQRSREITIRQGGIPLYLSVAGATIPTSGSVVVTAKSDAPLLYTGPTISPTGSESVVVVGMYGWLAGVYGYLCRPAASNPINTDANYTFVRVTAGSSVSCPDNSLFTVDTFGSEDCIQLLWMGQNDVPTGDLSGVTPNIQAAIANLKSLGKRFLIIGFMAGSGSPIGSGNYSLITAQNASMLATWPDNFVDIWTPVRNAYNPAIPQDVTDYNNGVTPSSLRIDAIHLTAAGYAIVAQTIYNAMLAKGWL